MKKMLFLFIAVFVINVSAQESLVLRYNYSKGDVYQINLKMTQEMGTVMAQTTQTTMTQTTSSTTDDAFVNDIKIDKMTMNMLQGGQVIEYDSSKKDEELDEMGKMMKTQMAPILSAVISTKINSLGDVLDVSVAPNIPQAKNMAKQNSSIVYPKEAVKVGSTWSTTKEESGMTIKIIYTVKTIAKDTVELLISGDISGMASGTVSGDMFINKATGVAVKSKIQMKMSAQGQEVNVGVEGSFTKK